MADKKITELPNMIGVNVDDSNDVLAIVDTSADTTNKITRDSKTDNETKAHWKPGIEETM